MFFKGVITNRPFIKRALETSRLSTQLLPSLLNFEAVVDVRFGFEKGRLSENVPVIIMHIDTDSMGQEIFLQLTKTSLERMIKDLEETLKNVVQVEKWIAQKSATGE